jgi:hypothetical protein
LHGLLPRLWAGLQQCPEMLQLTYGTNLIEVSPDWTILKLYMTSPIRVVKLKEASLNYQYHKNEILISHSAGKTELSFCSVYRKLYLKDRCHIRRQ